MLLWLSLTAPETTAMSSDDSRIKEDDLYLVWGKTAPTGTWSPIDSSLTHMEESPGEPHRVLLPRAPSWSAE